MGSNLKGILRMGRFMEKGLLLARKEFKRIVSGIIISL